MSDWIPTAERLPELDNRQVVVQWSDGNPSVVRADYVDANQIIAWQELPPPYVMPQPKRRSGWFKSNRLDHFKQSQDAFEAIEVLPGDPDPDIVLEVLAEMQQSHNPSAERWTKRIEESRSK